MQAQMRESVAALEAQQRDLERVLRSIGPDEWLIPTPAAGWDVRDQVSHLADTEEIAHDTITGGPRQLITEALSYPTPEAFTESGCERGRAMMGDQVLAWWVKGAARTREALAKKDPKDRVPWGLGMAARTFVAARLMETWAHGLDIRAAVGKPPDLTTRMKDVAWLVVRAFPYAFRHAGREQPPGTLRVDLNFDGDIWSFGPDDADNRITGDAEEFCRVGVQRMKLKDATTLNAQGPLAEAALEVARAFL